MNQFLGTHQNRLDAKGRVSVPAVFRSALRGDAEGEGPVTVILRPSHKHACIEGWPTAKFAALAAGLDKLDQFSDAHEEMSFAVYADAYPAESDKEGRIVLGDGLVKHAGLTSQVTFVGLGGIFQIWNPDTVQKRRADALASARLRNAGLPSAPAA